LPFKTKQKKYIPTNELPQNLAHKPVYAVPYERFDGFNTKETDVRFISVGLAQYDPYEVSVKIFRHTSEKWTRQSEELPIHRAIDAVSFIAKVIYDSDDGNVAIPTNTFENQNEGIDISREKRTSGELASFHRFFEENKRLISDRFNKLYEILDDMKRTNKL